MESPSVGICGGKAGFPVGCDTCIMSYKPLLSPSRVMGGAYASMCLFFRFLTYFPGIPVHGGGLSEW